MPTQLILEHTLSEIGRSTGKTLDCLRKQLGPGCDPVFDYSDAEEVRKNIIQRDKKSASKQTDDTAISGQPSGIDQLKRALKDLASGGRTEDELQDKDLGNSPASPVDLRRQREESRNTSAFKAPGRAQIQKLDLVNRFRAPPPGVYRPKDDLLDKTRRVQQVDFGGKERTRSRKVKEVLQEVERLKEAGEPYEHLMKSGTSIELREGIPENLLAKPKQIVHEWGKLIPRPDMIKSSKIKFHDNSFTAGILDGDKVRIDRQPEWDFSKQSTKPNKDREYFFQPGQFEINLDVVRTKLESKNIPFEKRPDRQPLRESKGRFEIKKREGDHLPDRSFARSCPKLSCFRDVKVPDIEKYTERPPIVNPQKLEYHDEHDPVIDEKVMTHKLTYDCFDAQRFMWPRSKSTEDFGTSLNRIQQLKIQRSYGNDIALQLSKDNVTRGPVSVELLDNWEIDKSTCLQKRPKVKTSNFVHMPGREREKKYNLTPARQKDHSKEMRFDRSVRDGDTKCQTSYQSDLAAGIKVRRAGRTYEPGATY